MDLPNKRETVLDYFDRIRKFRPKMDKFRRFDSELSLESPPVDGQYDWTALRQSSIRSGSVNPPDMSSACDLHRTILEIAPYYLSISPIEIDHLELMFGFDLEAKGNHDEIVFDALFADSSLGALINSKEEHPTDIQPFVGYTIEEDEQKIAVNFEIKTRVAQRSFSDDKFEDEPISVFVSARRTGPIDRIEDLIPSFHSLTRLMEQLATDKLIPCMLNPITRAISSHSC